MLSKEDRRLFPRLSAPVLCRPPGLRIFKPWRRAEDISQGGARIYSDEPMKVGSIHKIEMFLPDKTTINCECEVAWVEAREDSEPAAYDIGLRFMGLSKDAQDKLFDVLAEETGDFEVPSNFDGTLPTE